MRALRLQKEAEESAMEKAYRRDFEAARSFDLEDDELFCPFHLLTEDDVCGLTWCQRGSSFALLTFPATIHPFFRLRSIILI